MSAVSAMRNTYLLAIFPLLSLLTTCAAYCVDGYDPWFKGNCFKAISYNDNHLEYDSAKKLCASDNADLSSIHSDKENKIMANLMNSPHVWIGLECNATTRKWGWVDGTELDYTQTDFTGHPCDPSTGIYLKRDQTWWQATRYKYDGALCKHRRKSIEPCGYDQVVNSTTCVYLSNRFQTSWNDAESQCTSMDFHLISIHNQQMNDEILGRARALGVNDAIHIGLRTNASKNQTAWSDGTDFDYDNYLNGFPNDIFGHCSSLETLAGSGKWISSQCSSLALPFVCGKPVTTPSTQVPPVCPDSPYFFTPGEIFSPGYPSHIPVGLSCEYILAADEGKNVEIVFSEFDTNKCCDVLNIYDGAVGNHLIAGVAGSNIKGGYKFTTTNTNIMHLVWAPTDGVGVRGWRATWRAV